jgi:hypothetical protein
MLIFQKKNLMKPSRQMAGYLGVRVTAMSRFFPKTVTAGTAPTTLSATQRGTSGYAMSVESLFMAIS